MNSRTTHTSSGLRFALSRAQLSPLSRAQLRRSSIGSRSIGASVPAPDSLTPATPSLAERWFDPHLVDRLQTPLSRIRE